MELPLLMPHSEVRQESRGDGLDILPAQRADGIGSRSRALAMPAAAALMQTPARTELRRFARSRLRYFPAVSASRVFELFF
jgi:hypothetical protein